MKKGDRLKNNLKKALAQYITCSILETGTTDSTLHSQNYQFQGAVL